MKLLHRVAFVVLTLVFAASLLADWLAPASYARQFRESPNAPPSREFPLGTDELGRDRLSRVLHGSRVSLLLAPAAALLSTLLAAAIGGVAGYVGGRIERAVMLATDLCLSLPWLFLLLTVRALLPLNVSPWMSVVVTFALLGLLGWAGSARIVRAGMAIVRRSDFVRQARACGCRPDRLMLIHMLPNLKPILQAQFWVAVPVFLLAEANLGLLGLGVAEPLPSWGNLLRGLESYAALGSNPWTLAPAAVLVIVVGCLYILFPPQEYST